MGALVCQHIALLGKASTALPAFIRFLTRVDAPVLYQTIFSRKALVTFITLIRLLNHVNALVSCQSAFVHKAFVTLTAPKRLLIRVNQQMRFQVDS